jgi:hypothetical protein
MTDSDKLSAGQAPGVQAHMPGEDSTEKSAAGVVPDGTATDTLGDTDLPAGSGPSGGGDSVAGDATIPGTEESADDFGSDDAAQGHS